MEQFKTQMGLHLDALQCPVIQKDHPDYDAERSIYNGMIDRYPLFIAKCRNISDVQSVVDYARLLQLPLAVRGGGHSGPGHSICDDGVVLDLSGLSDIFIDPRSKTAIVGGGCILRDVDEATHAHGLAIPAGINPTTGIGGLTLGGGHGYLTRKFGLSIDSLLEVRVVLANGALVTASAKENEDLFWAIQGGGGNFGVIVSFKFALHPIKNILGGMTFWSLEDAGKIMKWYRDFSVQTTEDIYGFFSFHTVPSLDPFPADIQGQKVCGVVWCCTGDLKASAAELDAVLEKHPPLFNHVAEMPYVDLQTMFEPLYPEGLQWYWKGHYVKDLPDEAIDIHLKYADKLPTELSTMHLYPVDGAVHRRKSNESAFYYRDMAWSQVIVGVDPDPANNSKLKSWTRDYWHDLHPYSAQGGYVNFMMDDTGENANNAYGNNYDRLVEIKTKYDPENLFHFNQNIAPLKQSTALDY